MTEKTINVPNIDCGHCVATIKREVGEIKGVKFVDGDVKTKDVVVRWDDPATWETIAKTLDEIGYPPAK